MVITHLLFVDDILIFCNSSMQYIDNLFEVLSMFGITTGMQINAKKSTILCINLENEEGRHISQNFVFEMRGFEEGLKQLGFHLKPNNCTKSIWAWLLAKLDKILKT